MIPKIRKRKPHSKETIEKLRMATKKQHAEGRAVTRKKGEWKPTEEMKRKISISRKGKTAKEKHPLWKGGKPKCLDCNKQLSNYNFKRCVSCGQIERWNKKGRKKYPRYVHLCNTKEYKNWRLSVFLRDNWTCQNCKKIGGYLEAHHIKSWSHYADLRYDINNGVTLCKGCHALTDNYKGKGIKRDVYP